MEWDDKDELVAEIIKNVLNKLEKLEDDDRLEVLAGVLEKLDEEYLSSYDEDCDGDEQYVFEYFDWCQIESGRYIFFL